MDYEKKQTLDEIFIGLQNREMKPKKTLTNHLSLEKIFEYLDRRYELPLEDPMKIEVLDHIIYCRECNIKFRHAYELFTDIESNKIPETTEESKKRANIAKEPEQSNVVQWRRIGQFSKIYKLSPNPLIKLATSSPQKVAAKSQEDASERVNAESLTEDADAEIKANVFINHRGHIIGQLQGPKDKIAKIPVSLYSGEEEKLSVGETDEFGRVDFGSIENIPQAKEKGHILKLGFFA